MLQLFDELRAGVFLGVPGSLVPQLLPYDVRLGVLRRALRQLL